MRAREIMARLDRLPKRTGGEQKVWDLSLLSPEQQDRVSELSELILASKDIHSKSLDSVFAELDELVRALPLLGPNDPEQGLLIEVPRSLADYWQRQQPASKWRSLDFDRLSEVRTVRFVELCEKHGFTDGTDAPAKAQILQLNAWPAGDRTELEKMLDIAAQANFGKQ